MTNDSHWTMLSETAFEAIHWYIKDESYDIELGKLIKQPAKKYHKNRSMSAQGQIKS